MKRIINTNQAPAAIGPYSQAVEVGGTLYISGQIPLVPETMKIVEGGIREQTEQVLLVSQFMLTVKSAMLFCQNR